MAIHTLYDNGGPALPTVGWSGTLLSFNDSGSYGITLSYDMGSSILSPLAPGDVGIVRKKDDPSVFAVFYVIYAEATVGEEGQYPVSIDASWDYNIYSLNPTTLSDYSVYIYSTNYYSTELLNFADVISFNTSIEKSHYSNLMITYSKKISHKVSLNNLRRNFYPNSKNVLFADNIFLIDNCTPTPVAYKVAASDDTFDIFNNKYKDSISFSVAV